MDPEDQVTPETPAETPAVVETPATPETPSTPAPVVPQPKDQPKNPLMDPRVQAEIRRQAEDALKRGRAEAEAAAKLAAERAAMDETERLRLEKKEETEAKAAEAARREAAERERDIAMVLVKTGTQLADASAMAFLKYQTEQKVASNPALNAETAALEVLSEHPYLQKTVQVPQTTETTQTTQAAPAVQTPVTVAAPLSVRTQTPAAPTGKIVNTLEMSKAEYQTYKQKQHGI